MLNTANQAIPYYQPSDPADIAYITQAQAERIDALLTQLNDPPRARARRSTAQSITSATQTTVTFTAEDYDTAAMIDVATAATRVTIKTAGRYRVRGAAIWAANATGLRLISIVKNGATPLITPDGRVQPNTAGWETTQQLEDDDVVLAVNDYLELQVYQSSGAGLNLNGATLQARWMGK